jgi:hypothetical protein
METNKPAPPDDLGDVGRKLWVDTLADFDESHAVELALLHELALTVDEAHAMKGVVDREGWTVAGAANQIRPHPLIALIQGHRRLIDQLAVALALPTEGEAVGRRTSAAQKLKADKRWQAQKRRGQIPSVTAAQNRKAADFK